MRKICFVTGTRAEYGLLSRLMRMVKDAPETELQIIATNMHLSPKYGNTYQEIEDDGFAIDVCVPIIQEGETGETAVINAMSRALKGMGAAYEKLKPDLLVILGDRYEMLAAASAALIRRIPIAHISGGDVTVGAYDDAIRHSITKMSHLHFPSTDVYGKRIIQLGELPEHVFSVGALGVENCKQVSLMSKTELEQSLGFELDRNTIMVTYHPVTLSNDDALNNIQALLRAIHRCESLRVLFTMPNSDNGGDVISEAIMNYVALNTNRAMAFTSLGMRRYLSTMQFIGAVVGNSSSGIAEAPSFHIPTLDIGSRQQGRIAADSVWHCGTSEEEILEGLHHIMSDEFKNIAQHTANPYDKPGTAKAIFDIISTYPLEGLINKHFYDL